MDILARQTVAPTAPAASTVQPVLTAPAASTVQAVITALATSTVQAIPVAPATSTVQAVLTAPVAPAAPAASTVQAVITAPIAPVTSTVQAVLTAPVAPKQLSPDRPEVLMQAYLAEKTAWLAQHPTVRPTEYRKARKWKNPRPKVLKEQLFYMPKERRDLNGDIITTKANWTNKEITVWLDNEERKEEEEYNRLQVEFDANGQRHTENGRVNVLGPQSTGGTGATTPVRALGKESKQCQDLDRTSKNMQIN
ncbi:hypothetical protein NA56DRAFT_709468 [Hyaloscypha hepaticicola]|uniref:Uncharacterized protein n=1 Tax=Hyaloscypha hepaticicola TaxID=2082293 RepID=A0A2J6PP61_9HELO|nr:hypothetical protein NA56DRAFT_709468 [Hyaloscypha hepaticicola]